MREKLRRDFRERKREKRSREKGKEGILKKKIDFKRSFRERKRERGKGFPNNSSLEREK